MALLAICLFSILIFPPFSSSQASKMIAFNGIPSSLKGWKPSEIPWDACLSQCLNDLDCRVVFQNTSSCYVFKRGNITIQTSNSAADRVAVKIPNAPTTCFSDHYSYFNQSFTETLNGKQIIRSQFSYSSGQYRVVYTVSICPNTTDLYTRKVGTKTYQVCVGFRMFPGGSGSFYDAQNLCKTNGGYRLTGPLDAPEYDTLKDKGIAFRKQNGQSANALFWIDGLCNHTKLVFDYEDESHNGVPENLMHPGDPNDDPPSALYMYGASNGYWIADFAAERTDLIGYLYVGALCRVNDVLLQD